MRNILFSVLFALPFIYTNNATARTGSISGRVSDDGGKPLVFASVLLCRGTDTAVVKTEITDDKGEYLLTPAATGAYRIKVIMMGYETFVSDRVTVSENTVTMPEAILHSANAGLKDVSVTAQRPFIEVHPDKLVVNVDASIVSAGSSVMDVLSRSPGVTVDQDDNISLKGKQGVNVMMDGRTLPVSSADLANMLKSMPSGSVDKIEIITNPSSKYDAAGTAGIINIKTKKDNRMGFNASVNGSYSQGVYPKENLGFNLNYKEQKLNVYANYSANYRTGFSRIHWDRKFYANDTFNGAYDQENYTVLQFRTNIAGAGVDYNLTSKTTIGASVTGESFYLGTTGYYFANVYGAGNQLQSFFATNNTSGGTWNNYAPNIHLKHTFDTSGKELTVDVDYARYWNNNTQDFTTQYLALNGTQYLPDYILHGNITGLTEIRSVKADYTNPFKNGMSMDAGIKSSFVTADNEPIFYNRSNGGNVYDSGISDHYIYNENINAAYINASKDWTKWSAQFGLRGEQTIVSGVEKTTGQTYDNDYFQLFPSFAVQEHLNKANDVELAFSRRIERPEYDDLNPYIFFVDPTTYKTGNPHLQPALTYSGELSHTYKQRFITSVAYSVTNNVITEVIKPSTTQDKVTIQTKDNLALMKYAGVSGAYTIPFYKWWTNITNFAAFYAQYEGNLSNTNLDKGQPSFNINTSNKFTLPKGWSVELTFFYQAAQVYGFLNLTPISMLNAGIQKVCCNKRLTIRLNANDIFWQGNESGSSYFVNYTEVFTALHDTRQVSIALTYRFGNTSLAPVRRHNSGDEEERKRAGQAGA